ncbi:MAG: hypothetical protein R3C14_28595 [Caldilineaceae bacterium]
MIDPAANGFLHSNASGNGAKDSSVSKITQLYAELELFSLGEPPQHTLFILDRTLAAAIAAAEPAQEQLLVIDPPVDVAQRFRLADDTAALFTGEQQPVGLPLVETRPGGVAHLRVGQHFLDLYSQRHTNIICLPALNILCGGDFGSDACLPAVATGSNGDDELETLRLLARLVKQRPLQLYIPRVGALSKNAVEVMERLAANVAYLHSLRRALLPLAQRQAPLTEITALAPSLLPAAYRATNETRHLENLRRLYIGLR